MKINWGTGIFLFYSFFALTLFCQVYASTKYDRSLVVDNYYEKDLAYQQTYNKLQNALNLKDSVQLEYYEGFHLVELQFPKKLKPIKGTVLFYRPSDKKLDVLLPIRVDCENVMDIFIRKLTYGKWVVEIDWEADQTTYLNRFTIEVPLGAEEELIIIK